MGRKTSIFNDYNTKENILSNHCGVILKLLYEENPKSFEKVVSNLISQDFMISPSFNQQMKNMYSVPDIVIEQKSFTIFFETKIFGRFCTDQIKGYLQGFKEDTAYNILFLLSNFEMNNIDEDFENQIKYAYDKFNIILSHISFERLLGVLESVETSDNYKKYLFEFRDFLERNNYLQTRKHKLSIVSENNTEYLCKLSERFNNILLE